MELGVSAQNKDAQCYPGAKGTWDLADPGGSAVLIQSRSRGGVNSDSWCSRQACGLLLEAQRRSQALHRKPREAYVRPVPAGRLHSYVAPATALAAACALTQRIARRIRPPPDDGRRQCYRRTVEARPGRAV
jgi:hypothetical protein